MKKRGTGWIPDYPDIKDYTLNSTAIHNLANKIQSQGANASIENLAQKVYEALVDFIDIQMMNHEEDHSEITELRDKLEKDILGDTRFVTVELYSVLKPGMFDSEVLLIKNYLQRIISTWKQFKNIKYQPAITNSTFDLKTQEIVVDILKNQGCLQVDGFVGKDDMEALTLLAHGVDLDRDLEPFLELMEKNANKYKTEIAKYKEQNNPFPNNSEELNLLCQGLLTVYLLPIILNLRTPKELFARVFNYDVKSEKIQLQEDIKRLKPNIDTAVENLALAVEAIKSDRKFIEKIIEKFKNSLKTDFDEDELRDLTDITSKGQGLNTKIIQPLTLLVKQYDNYDEKKIVEEHTKIIKILSTTIREFEKMMGLLYMAYPPEIPSEIFQKKEIAISPPIPDLLVKLFNSKFPNKISSKLELKLLPSENKTSIQQLIDSLRNNPIPQEILQSLIEVLAQVLMPLGQYSNLSEAVEQGIEKILDLITGKQDSYQEIRGLIRETIEEYNFGMARNYSLMMELNLQDLILTALQRFITELEQPTIENPTQENKGELQDTGLYENLLIEKKSPGNQTQKPIKKPLFKITNIEPTSSREINRSKPSLDKTLLSKSKTASQQKNSLQFPLCSQLRKQIKAKALEKQECNDKSIFLSLPEFVDLTYWCSPVEDQGPLNSCTAHAGVALMEYAEKKSSETYTDASPLFLYRVTRNLMQREGDSGASVRDTIKAMVAFGVCPEEHWPYNEDRFDQEPTPFCYSFAENYKTIKYFRLDYGQISRYTLLSQVKVLLASEIPCIFGFTLYNSVYDEVNVLKGHIPLPNKRSKVIGGHTVVAVGYHDRKIIENEDGKTSKGALLIRNSWGTRWGQGGYGWLPYDYIMEGLTADWWSLLKAEWLATGRFGAGASAWNPDKGDRDGDIKEGQTD